nr:PLDc N-terminal domain-containing protein [Verrucomicrobiota bacterium]
MNNSGLLEALNVIWPYVIAVVTWVASVLASGHAILYKRDPRSAVLWTGLIWLLPLAGALLYFILGINRIRRRALVLRGQVETYRSP